MIRSFNEIREICSDGSFYVVPRLFTKILIISIRKQQRFLPSIFVLMNNRSKDIYKAVFEEIKEIVPTFLPQKAICDFELAAINAIKEAFQDIEVQGCYFHYLQANIRKLGTLGLKNFYTKNSQAKSFFKMVFGIGFLNQTDMDPTFEHISQILIGNSTQQPKSNSSSTTLVISCYPRYPCSAG